jgi:hypothetical protein
MFRFYTESGQLVVQRSFLPTAVKQLKIQSMPEGKHAANILYTQAALELIGMREASLPTIRDLIFLYINLYCFFSRLIPVQLAWGGGVKIRIRNVKF